MEENICNFFPRVQAWDLGARGTKNELFKLEDMYKNKERVKSVTAHIEVDRVKPYVHVLLLLYRLTISICRVLMAKTRGYKRVRGVIYSIPLFTGSYTSYTSCRISANSATLQPICPFLSGCSHMSSSAWFTTCHTPTPAEATYDIRLRGFQ